MAEKVLPLCSKLKDAAELGDKVGCEASGIFIG
jgi:hypothetical protein